MLCLSKRWEICLASSPFIASAFSSLSCWLEPCASTLASGWHGPKTRTRSSRLWWRGRFWKARPSRTASSTMRITFAFSMLQRKNTWPSWGWRNSSDRTSRPGSSENATIHSSVCSNCRQLRNSRTRTQTPIYRKACSCSQSWPMRASLSLALSPSARQAIVKTKRRIRRGTSRAVGPQRAPARIRRKAP